ncbi:hypothetical protein [Desulfocurvus sp. DL9XJH121]
MSTDSTRSSTARDPLSELFDVASALHFLGDAFDSLDQAGTPVRATGAGCLAEMLGDQVHALACALWAQAPPSAPRPRAEGPDTSPDEQRNQPTSPSEK